MDTSVKWTPRVCTGLSIFTPFIRLSSRWTSPWRWTLNWSQRCPPKRELTVLLSRHCFCERLMQKILIVMECYCVVRKKPISQEKTKPQTAAAVISMWFWGLLACPELMWLSLHNQWSWNFWGVYGFLSLTVTTGLQRHLQRTHKAKCQMLHINFIQMGRVHVSYFHWITNLLYNP